MNVLAAVDVGVDNARRLRDELRCEGWTPEPGGRVETWSLGEARLMLSEVGVFSYFGPEERMPPLAEVDVLEPVLLSRRPAESGRPLLSWLERGVFESFEDEPAVAEGADVRELERWSDRLAQLERMRTLLAGRGRMVGVDLWDGKVERWRLRLGEKAAAEAVKGRRTLRMLQRLAVMAVAADLGQFALALADVKWWLALLVGTIASAGAVAGWWLIDRHLPV